MIWSATDHGAQCVAIAFVIKLQQYIREAPMSTDEATMANATVVSASGKLILPLLLSLGFD